MTSTRLSTGWASKGAGKMPSLSSVFYVSTFVVLTRCLHIVYLRFTPGGVRKGAAGFDVTFIHPKGNDDFPVSGEGVLIELVQAPPEVIDAFDTISNASQ